MVTLGSSALAYYLPEPYRKRTAWGKAKLSKKKRGDLVPLNSGELPPMKFFLGTGVVFFGISAVGEFKPELAGPFAGLLATTALLTNGIPAVEYVVKGEGDKKVSQPIDTETGDLTAEIQTLPDPPVIHFPISEPRRKTSVIVVPGTQGKKIRLKANG